LRAKSIGGKRIDRGDLPVLPQKVADPSGARPGRPYIRLTLFLEKEGLARPTQEMKCASWFLHAKPLLSGLATPEIQ